MSLFTITKDKSNKDIPSGMTALEARSHYHAMSDGFVSKLSKPVVQTTKTNMFLEAMLVSQV